MSGPGHRVMSGALVSYCAEMTRHVSGWCGKSERIQRVSGRPEREHGGQKVGTFRSMDVYGLTGGIGSGKSAVAELLQQYGIPVVSADELSRIVVAPGSDGLHDVVAAFGEGVLGPRAELDRSKMAAIIFKDTEGRKKLEAILHPRIRERYGQVLDALEGAGHDVVVYEVPLLFEKGLQGDMQGVVLVTANERTRIARVMHRDGVAEAQVRARMKTQMPEEHKRRKANYIIENDGDLDDLRREVEFLLSRFIRVEDDGRARPVTDRAVGPAPSGAPSTVPRHDSSPLRDIGPQGHVVTHLPESTPQSTPQSGGAPATSRRQGSSRSGEVTKPAPSTVSTATSPVARGKPGTTPASKPATTALPKPRGAQAGAAKPGPRDRPAGPRKRATVAPQPSTGLPRPSTGLPRPSTGLPRPSVGLPKPSAGLPKPSSAELHKPSAAPPKPATGPGKPSAGGPNPSAAALPPKAPPPPASPPLPRPPGTKDSGG